MTPEQYIQKLIEISSKKLECLKEILKLTNAQSIVISEDSADEITKLVGLKQVQIEAINELDNAFEVYYSRLKSVMGIQSIEEIKMSQITGAADLNGIITEIYNTIKQIQALEVENKNRVQEILNRLSSEIRRVKQSKVANNGYNVASHLQQPSYFIDKKK